MQEPIQAVLFDYGLVLTGPPDPASWLDMQRTTGLSETAFSAAYWAPRHDYDRGQLSGRQYWLAVGLHAGLRLSDAQVDRLIAADIALWTKPNAPMIDWARRLQSAGTRTGILSNLGDEMMHGILATFPWLDGFHHRTWSHTLLLAKPDPEIYAHAAKGLDVSPSHILFVDDREENIAGAVASGMQAILYADHVTFLNTMRDRGLGELWTAGRA